MSLAACGSCSKDDPGASADGGQPAPVTSGTVVAEPLPRCRRGAERLAIPGDEATVGDVAIGPAGLLAGVVRVNGGKRVASMLRAPLTLAEATMTDLGVPLGDDPPPSPRWNGSKPWVAYIAGRSADGGTKLRELVVKEVVPEGAGTEKKPLSIFQQADESTAFDLAWAENGAGLVAWDEDAPVVLEAGVPAKKEATTRGVVKVQALTADAAPRTASPDTSDAESPRLVAKPGGGFWLAWMARRAEEEPSGIEGPGEPRAFRWIEVLALSGSGEPQGKPMRVSSEKGRAVAFELARSGSDLVIMLQDEIAASEGGGARIVRYKLGENGKPEAADVVKDGVGHALADLVPTASGEPARWLAWSDTSEHARLTLLGPGLVAQGRASSEPTLDNTRILASSDDTLFALAATDKPTRPQPELLRFVCR
ncbi:MAG: hypothetical protein KIT84_27920 [Labilithrix sp.]|nr:hypothetical protein [Labilithrix sp.]MCW5814887.1 hypothetical protein [Labilithrix sp.]